MNLINMNGNTICKGVLIKQGMHTLVLGSTRNIPNGHVAVTVQCTLEVRLYPSINLQSLLLL